MTDHSPAVLDNDELLAHVLASTGAVRHGQEQLRAHLDRRDEPGRLSTFSLSAAKPSDVDTGSVDEPSLSIGVLNPNAVTIVLGIGGGSATTAAEGIPVGPNQLMVLPISVAQVEIAVDPPDIAALGAATAIVFVIRFKHVQPAFLGVGV